MDDNGEGQEAGKRLKLNQGDLPWEDLPVNLDEGKNKKCNGRNNEVNEENEHEPSHDFAELQLGHSQHGNRPEGLNHVREHISPRIGEDGFGNAYPEFIGRRDQERRGDCPFGPPGGDKVILQS